MMEEDTRLVKELEERVESLLTDELLRDIPEHATIEEIETLIAIEEGQSYRVKIDRGPLPPVFIVVGQASTVKDIKKLVQSAIGRHERAEKKSHKHISWKYIWQSHCLMFEQEPLKNDQAVETTAAQGTGIVDDDNGELSSKL